VIGGKYFLTTYGCQMNVYDSETIAATLEGLSCYPVESADQADVIVFNTCCVRENADLKVYGKLGEFKSLKVANPDLSIVVAGCLAQKDGEAMLERFPYVDLILGTHNLRDLSVKLLEVRETRKSIVHVEQSGAAFDLPARRQSSISAWIPISVGCDEYCTFCIVPFVRGRMRSRPPEAVVIEAKRLAAQGYVEMTLLGQNVNAYGDDLTPKVDFADLLYKLADVKGLQRLRFTSPHPRNFSDRVLEAMAAVPHVCEHVHLPLQSGDDTVLRRMNRPYTRQQFMELAARIRAKIPGVAITTDIIVGFPGETEEQFDNTLDVVERVGFDGAYMFAYSERGGTSAMRLKDHLPEEVRLDRLHRLIRIQNDITREHNRALVGQVQQVLVEGPSKKDPSRVTGHTRGRRVVNFTGTTDLVGKLVDVRLTEGFTWGLMGELAVSPAELAHA
jgi:tRNA-2-methylthio-N6-dimethylallyladenosine synthase